MFTNFALKFLCHKGFEKLNRNSKDFGVRRKNSFQNSPGYAIMKAVLFLFFP